MSHRRPRLQARVADANQASGREQLVPIKGVVSMRGINKFWLTGTLIALWSSVILENGAGQAARGNTQDHVTSDDVVLRWNEIAVSTIGAQPPFPSTRFMAAIQLAVFEAVNS